jgi:hypothetical protein
MIIRQAELCRQLVTDTAEPWGRLHEQGVDARSPVMPPCIELPAHVSLMGISAMPPIYLDACGRLAEYIDLHLQNQGIAEAPTSFFAQTTGRSMCMSVIVACSRLRLVLPALMALCLKAYAFATAWTTMVTDMLERVLATPSDPAWGLYLRASVQVWSQS